MAKTDFGSPKPKKKGKDGSDKLSLKLKGQPKEVHKILDRMSGAGDAEGMSQKAPGPRGPRHFHHTPQKMSAQTVPALAQPLGASGKKPRLKANTGAGDAPLPFRGGAQPILSVTKLTVLKRPSSAKNPRSNNPEAPRKGPMPGKRPVGLGVKLAVVKKR